MVDQRKDKRAPASLKVKYKSATVDEFIEQFGSDVSRGGIFIKTKKPIETGALLKLELQLSDASPVIHGIGRVCFRRETSTDANLPAGMGIKFIKLDPGSRTIVERIVHARGERPSRFDQTEGAELAPPSIPPSDSAGDADLAAHSLRPTPAPAPAPRAPIANGSGAPQLNAKPAASANARTPAISMSPNVPPPAPSRAPQPPRTTPVGNRPLPLGMSSPGASAAQASTAPARTSMLDAKSNAARVSAPASLPAKEASTPAVRPTSPAARRMLGASPGAAAVAGLFADSPIAQSSVAEPPQPSSSRSSFFPPAPDDAADALGSAKQPPAARTRTSDVASMRAAAKGPATAARAEQARHSGEFLATAFAGGGVTKATADQARASADAQRSGEDALIDQLFEEAVEPVPSAPPVNSVKAAQDSMDDMFAALGQEEKLGRTRRSSVPSAAAIPAGRGSDPGRISGEENVDDLFAELNKRSRPPARAASFAASELESASEVPGLGDSMPAFAGASAAAPGAAARVDSGEWDDGDESNEADIGMSEAPAPFSQPPRISVPAPPPSSLTEHGEPRAAGPGRWIALGVLAVLLAGGGWFAFGRAKPNVETPDPVKAVPLGDAPPAAPTAAAPTADPSAAPAAPSAASAAAATIEVEVSSVPRGADVLLNGKREGSTPARVKLQAGEPAKITVSSSGYASMTKSVTPSADQSALRFELEPLPYSLTVRTIPDGANVTIGDKSATAPGPIELGHLDGGVLVSVGKSGYQRMTRPLRLDEFSERDGVMHAEIEVRLSALPGVAPDSSVRARIRRRPDEPPAPPEPTADAPPEAPTPPAAAAEPEKAAAPEPAPGTPPPAPELPPDVAPAP